MTKRRAIPKEVRDRLLVEAMHRCCLCPEHHEVVDLHHIVPISEDGPNTGDNLMVVCPTCHAKIHRIRNRYNPKQLRMYKKRWVELCDLGLPLDTRIAQAFDYNQPPLPPQPPDPEPKAQLNTPDTTLIPAGPFWMGSDFDDTGAYANEKPRRKLDLPEYLIGRYPVTNAQYACFVRDTGHAPPEHWDGENVPTGLEDHPVVNVSHADAEAYCRWLSQFTGEHYRLPTEAEWEKAARGGLPETRHYPWRGDWHLGICNTEELNRNSTTPVYKFEPTNQSPFGVVDMAGNVWEWTASWYQKYPGSPHESRKYGQKFRVVRGGSWDYPAQSARISCRGRYKPDERRAYLGFRAALETPLQKVDAAPEEPPKPKDAEPGIPKKQRPLQPKDIDHVKLRQLIIDYFDKEELRTLCFDLEVDYDSLRGEGKAAKARDLVAYFKRNRSISELAEACRQRRSHVSW